MSIKVSSTFFVALHYKKKCKLHTSCVLLVGYNLFVFITCYISNKYLLYIYQQPHILQAVNGSREHKEKKSNIYFFTYNLLAFVLHSLYKKVA